MNYRHAFHAANFADVVKHAALALLVERLKEKQAAFAALDLFAGAGLYDLEDEAARKTAEAEAGLFRLWPAPPTVGQGGELGRLLAPWLGVVAQLNAGRAARQPRHYPGSPELLRRLLRPQDRLVLAELHPEEGASLKRRYARDPQVAVHLRDGFEALPALVPPEERRGLVLIDPPYEQPDEPQRLGRALERAWRRWPTGIYLLWYPLKDPADSAPWLEALARSASRPLLQAEVTLFEQLPAWRLNGCGLLLLNAPWRFEQALRALLQGLQPLLARDGGASRVRWLGAKGGRPGT